ncbi:hypothetical protein FB451DRAFT_1367082 [Mycena latifolia]|nr:hypothetical protein FB451DRAFT_1367082 [Mycena latifolia]
MTDVKKRPNSMSLLPEALLVLPRSGSGSVQWGPVQVQNRLRAVSNLPLTLTFEIGRRQPNPRYSTSAAASPPPSPSYLSPFSFKPFRLEHSCINYIKHPLIYNIYTLHVDLADGEGQICLAKKVQKQGRRPEVRTGSNRFSEVQQILKIFEPRTGPGVRTCLPAILSCEPRRGHGAVPGYIALERYSSGSPFASFLAVKARDKGGIDRDLRNLLDSDPQHYIVSSIVIPSSIESCFVTAIDVFSVASAVSQSCRNYTLLGANCLWFAGAIMHAICEIFLGHPGPDHGPAWSSTALLLWSTDFGKGLKIIKESYQKARHELQVQVGHEKVKMELEDQKVKDLESEKMARIKSLEEKDENNQEVHQVVVLKINIR